MLVAIPKEGDMVCAHFGHCEEFTLYDTNAKTFKSVANPGHQPGFLPGFLKEQGVELVIAGGMGGRAQDLFAAQGIQLIVGISGKIEDVIVRFEKDELVSSGEVCSEHAHAGDCHS
ncbi:MAG: NifB/NifX family molybdenum-iron cluster-binding protein [Syntrophomonas sp.]|uniref:NifB/NifX family molybdenum-iron cluster-binding protein n=1 Tax=Syntrophomonas sp. TaxID=2053627 RepID=UPI002618A6D8|nr:NifB/NifX family molybdenum-iron cluster-binding protein [Syntrophomonas sp.]MDD2510872.1 NifB/NifX family molybdenum-iron cluster-binding protein [Syntrophomonas sp.]MDD4626652.1 NifB/NifX family molybdenum-iron cluster-binding protein [Syntrophomonas sp.]